MQVADMGMARADDLINAKTQVWEPACAVCAMHTHALHPEKRGGDNGGSAPASHATGRTLREPPQALPSVVEPFGTVGRQLPERCRDPLTR